MLQALSQTQAEFVDHLPLQVVVHPGEHMDTAVPCFYCGHSPTPQPYGKEVYVGCGNHKCWTVNGVIGAKLEVAVGNWNREQHRLEEKAHG